MNKLPADEWESKCNILSQEMNQYIITDTPPQVEYLEHIRDETDKLRDISPFEDLVTTSKMALLISMGLELRNIFRRSRVDPEKQRGIKPAWIIERYMAPEGNVTLLYKKPDDSKILLFREGDDKDGVTVEYKSKEHRDSHERSLYFRRTSIGPDDVEDDDGDSEITPKGGPTSGNEKHKEMVLENIY